MQGKLLCRTLTVFVTVAWASLTWAITPVFLLDAEGPSGTQLYRVDTTTGELTQIGTALPDLFGPGYGLAAASDNRLYVTTGFGAVLQVNVDPFGVMNLGTVLGSLVGLAFSLDAEALLPCPVPFVSCGEASNGPK